MLSVELQGELELFCADWITAASDRASLAPASRRWLGLVPAIRGVAFQHPSELDTAQRVADSISDVIDLMGLDHTVVFEVTIGVRAWLGLGLIAEAIDAYPHIYTSDVDAYLASAHWLIDSLVLHVIQAYVITTIAQTQRIEMAAEGSMTAFGQSPHQETVDALLEELPIGSDPSLITRCSLMMLIEDPLVCEWQGRMSRFLPDVD